MWIVTKVIDLHLLYTNRQTCFITNPVVTVLTIPHLKILIKELGIKEARYVAVITKQSLLLLRKNNSINIMFFVEQTIDNSKSSVKNFTRILWEN